MCCELVLPISFPSYSFQKKKRFHYACPCFQIKSNIYKYNKTKEKNHMLSEWYPSWFSWTKPTTQNTCNTQNTVMARSLELTGTSTNQNIKLNLENCRKTDPYPFSTALWKSNISTTRSLDKAGWACPASRTVQSVWRPLIGSPKRSTTDIVNNTPCGRDGLRSFSNAIDWLGNAREKHVVCKPFWPRVAFVIFGPRNWLKFEMDTKALNEVSMH